MCRSCAEGGDRCVDRRWLESLSLDDLLPEPAEGQPTVDWGAEPAPAMLWKMHPAQVASEAVRVIRQARAAEARTTADFLASLPAWVTPHALQFRMKSPSSLARKLQTKAQQNAQTVSEGGLRAISDKLTDVLRYTALTHTSEKLIESVKSTVAGMLDRGYRVVSAEQSYVTGNVYKGIHLLLQKGEDERPIEIQFHTQLSQAVKDVNHVDYEIARERQTPYAERAAVTAQMEERSASIPVPADISGFHTVGGCEVVTKRYPNPYAKGDNGRMGGSKR